MARNAIREPRHIPTPQIIGEQPDLFNGPTLTHEHRRRPLCAGQILAWGLADTLGDMEETDHATHASS